MRNILTLALILPGTAFGETFQPPLPEVQSATAEFSYAIASIAFIATLAMAQFLIRKR